MSIKVMAHIWDQNLKPTLKFILLALGDHADHNGKNIYPSVDLIAMKTGYNRRTVQNAIKEAKDKKLIDFIRIHPVYKTNEYRYTWVNLIHPHESENAEGVNLDSQEGESDSPKPLINHHDKPLINGDEDIDPFPFKTKTRDPIYHTETGRVLMESVLFPLMPAAIDYFETVANAAGKYGQEPTREALIIALNDWKKTKGKNKRGYNPHNYNWISWAVSYLNEDKKTWKEPTNDRDPGNIKQYSETDQRIADEIRAS